MFNLKSKRDYFYLILSIVTISALYFVYAYSAGNETTAERQALLVKKDADLFIGKEYEEDIGILYAVSKGNLYGYAHFKKAKLAGYELVDIYLTTKPFLYQTVYYGSEKHDVFMTNIQQIESAKMTYYSGGMHDEIVTYQKPAKKTITKQSILVTEPATACYFIAEIIDSSGNIYKYSEKDLSVVSNIYHIAWYNKMAKNNLYGYIILIAIFLISTDNFYQLRKNGELTKKEIFRYAFIFSLVIFYHALLLFF